MHSFTMLGIKKRFQVARWVSASLATSTPLSKKSLKLATTRIKSIRNEKGVQVIQMKKELAQLLAAGDDRTALIRVEDLIREEKMIGAYDLIEKYCELIVESLPNIESQETCPIDLKEAITSVIFAVPRCSDITELVDVKKNFRAKYGNEFVTAATELIPGCGVSQMLVEKLSADAPNIQTKVKVLSDIAKEHNVNWEAASFEESKPPDDFLNGNKNFEQVNPITVDLPKVQSHQTTPNVSVDFSEKNKRFTSDAQNLTAADTGSQQSSYASTSHKDARSTDMNQLFRSNRNNSNYSSDRENENESIDFEDATSAAHAGAEAAEHASNAARAAAQLARQGSVTQQYPTESQESHIRDENNTKSKLQNQQVRQNESNSSPKVTKSSSHSRSRHDSDESSVIYDDHSFHSARSDDESKTDDDNDYDGLKFDAGFDQDDLEDAAKSFFPSPDKEENSHICSPMLDDLMQKSSSFPKQSDVLDTEEDLRVGTLASSRRTKGNKKYAPHTKITSLSSKKPVEESPSPVKVDQASTFKTSSEFDADDKPPVKPSRSAFARPNTIFSYGNDSDEEVKASHGVSCRTKGQVKPKKPTHVHPKLPEFETLADRISAMYNMERI